MNFQPVATTVRREDHQVVVRLRGIDVLDPVVLLGTDSLEAATATPLAAVGAHGEPLDVAEA